MFKKFAKNETDGLAPVVFFAFNRPSHTEETLRALAANDLAIETDLYIYVDGPRNIDDQNLISQVNAVLSNLKGFKSIEVIHRSVNYGLAKNIIDGVSEILQKKQKVIVLEDDILTSQAFLTFMNSALNLYKNENKVWHISGYVDPLKTSRIRDTFFWRVMDCWGWATWADRWSFYEKNAKKLVSEFSGEEIHRFNVDGESDFWSQVLANLNGEINSWAIFWYASIFKNQGLCLSPFVSYTQNIGFDGSGVHCHFDQAKQGRHSLNPIRRFTPPKKLMEDPEAVYLMKQFFRSPVRHIDHLGGEPIGDLDANMQNNVRTKIKKFLKAVLPSRVRLRLRKLINLLRGM